MHKTTKIALGAIIAGAALSGCTTSVSGNGSWQGPAAQTMTTSMLEQQLGKAVWGTINHAHSNTVNCVAVDVRPAGDGTYQCLVRIGSGPQLSRSYQVFVDSTGNWVTDGN